MSVMETGAFPTPSRPASGGVIRLQARLADVTTWLGPTWAALCGVIASNSFAWQGDDWLRLAFLVLLVEGGWGTLWAALGNTDWAMPLRSWRGWSAGQPSAALPYTRPGSPGGRASHWLGQLRTWWWDDLRPNCGPALSAVAIALPITAALSGLLGPELVLLSLAAIAVMQLGLAWESGRGTVTPEWDAAIAVLLPWMAGHIAFGSLTVKSAVVAFFFAIAYGAVWRAGSRLGRVLYAAAHLVVAAVIIALYRPLEAGATLLLLIPPAALAPWVRQGEPVAWYLRHTRPWLMVAMLTAAWAL